MIPKALWTEFQQNDREGWMDIGTTTTNYEYLIYIQGYREKKKEYKRPVYIFAFLEYKSKQVNVSGIQLYLAQI